MATHTFNLLGDCVKCGEHRDAYHTSSCPYDYGPPAYDFEPGEGAKDTNPKDAIGATKAPLGLFPSTALVAGAMAFLEGATKYGRYNWRVAGVRSSIYRDALGRHIEAWWNGEDLDPDSGLPHLWKALACIAILIDSDQAGKLSDDRPPKVDVAGMIQDWTPLVEEIKERNKDRNPKQYTIEDSE